MSELFQKVPAIATRILHERRNIKLSFLLIFFGYVAVAQCAYYLYHGVGTMPNVILAPAGVSLAAVILEGYIALPIIAMGAFFSGLLSGTPFILLLGSVIGNTLQPAVSLYVLRRLGFERLFYRLRDMFSLVFVALFCSTIVPFVSTISYVLYNVLFSTTRQPSFTTWWLGSALSSLIISPFLIRWIRRPFSPYSKSRYLEVISALTILFVTIYLATGTTQNDLFGFPLIYVTLVALIWVAFRGGVRYTTLALLGMSIISFLGAIYGVHLSEPTDISKLIVNTQIFDLCIAVFFFILVSLEEQRRHVVTELSTQAQKLQEALTKIHLADMAKNEFIALLGHELRNPLATLLSSVEVIHRIDPPKPERDQFLENMETRIHAMAHLLEDILDISRITQRKFTLRTERVNIPDALSRVIKAMDPQMKKRHHTFQYAISDDVATVLADVTRFEQIFFNLLDNAAKYTPPRGRIKFDVFTEGFEVVFSVKDTGIGISPAIKQRIFEPFMQVRPRQVGVSGVGIGLSLTKSLVTMQGGQIEVHSEGEGKGSEFIVRFPHVSGVEDASVSSTKKINNTEEKQSALHILIVDDNEVAAQALARLLGLRGHSVALAYNGQTALTAVQAYEPDVVVLDIGLPDIDGYQVARRLRSEGYDQLLIALSGYGQESDKRKAAEAGFDFHLMKPIVLADIEPLLVRPDRKKDPHSEKSRRSK